VTEIAQIGVNRECGSCVTLETSNIDSDGDIVKVEATLWINGDGFPQATLHLPSGNVILQIPSKDPKGNVRASKPYLAVMEALAAEESKES
jgi:hypothetical protein